MYSNHSLLDDTGYGSIFSKMVRRSGITRPVKLIRKVYAFNVGVATGMLLPGVGLGAKTRKALGVGSKARKTFSLGRKVGVAIDVAAAAVVTAGAAGYGPGAGLFAPGAVPTAGGIAKGLSPTLLQSVGASAKKEIIKQGGSTLAREVVGAVIPEGKFQTFPGGELGPTDLTPRFSPDFGKMLPILLIGGLVIGGFILTQRK